MEAFLYRLPTSSARCAGDALTAALRSLAPAGSQPSEIIDELSDGQRRLFEFDLEAIAREVSRAVGSSMTIGRALPPTGMPALSGPRP